MFCNVDPFCEFLGNLQLNGESQPWFPHLGTSSSGSRGLILTPISPAGVLPLAIFVSRMIQMKEVRKIAKSCEDSKLTPFQAADYSNLKSVTGSKQMHMVVSFAAGPIEFLIYPLKQGLLMHKKLIFHCFHSGIVSILLKYVLLITPL